MAENTYSQEKQELLSGLSAQQREIISRLEYELMVVNLMGFNGYFCIVSDFIRYGKNNGIPV